MLGASRTGLLVLALLGATGCADDGIRAHQNRHPTTRVVVVAPVLNLSGSSDFDVLKVTDTVASEFCSFPGVAVVPVNVALAGLARRGRLYAESPEDALALGRDLSADAVVVVSVTENVPYQPPVIGLVMQWYDVSDGDGGMGLASWHAPEVRGPSRQLQRVFNAARRDVQDEVMCYAARRDFGGRPLGWRTVTSSQEMFLRYCCWSMIRTILMQDGFPDEGTAPH